MFDAIVRFLQSLGAALGRVFSVLSAWIAWPFMAVAGWYRRRGWLIRAPILAVLAVTVLFYASFVWKTQVWSGFDPDFVNRYKLAERMVPAGQELPAPPDGQAGQGAAARSCQTAAIVDVTADLIDFNVNRNAWISSMLLYRLGLFGIDWDHTPFLDNKASFQRGINQAVRRTAVELVDTLGRVRGTSGINNNLQDARGYLQFDEFSWYFGLDPFGFKTPTPSYYRSAMGKLRAFNRDLSNCAATFDSRVDNLIQFVDRIASDLGGTSAILRDRSENYNAGWFDSRADDRFWFAYGQLYGYYAILSGAGADFSQVIRERNLTALWTEMLSRFRAALRMRPAIISNGREDGLVMPSHLAVMGFHILGVRSNLVEIRSVLDR